MRPPRFRLRTLMVAVAVVAVMSGVGVRLGNRSLRFRNLADHHGLEETRHVGRGYLPGPETVHIEVSTPKSEHHARLREKYRRAAARPWLPVPLDPPEPE